jgi:uncharacterized protein (TIGR00290 family)
MLHGEPVLLAFSGGKDSLMALSALAADVRHEVVALLLTVDSRAERVAMHGVPLALVASQAQALGLPLRVMRIPPGADDRAYALALEEALEDARRLSPRLRHLAFGDLHLADVRAWRESLLSRLGWEALFPLWGRDTAMLARRVIDGGFEARIVCVDRERLDPRFLGRSFDPTLLAELPPECDPCGERGEFHTFVSQGPAFAFPVATADDGVEDDGRFLRLRLRPADAASA